MKKLITLAIVAMLFASCADMLLTPEEREIKKHVTNYLKENLHDPSSLKDLKIDYAFLTKDSVRSLWEAELEKEGYRETCLPGILADNYALIVEYRAKNAYGAYRIGHELLLYNACRYREWLIKPLRSDQAYVIDYNAFDWKTIPAK